MKPPQSQALDQLSRIEALYGDLQRQLNRSGHWPDELSSKFNSLALATIKRIAGLDSSYYVHALNTVNTYGINHNYNIDILYGIATSLKQDVEDGYLQDVAELIHADVFSDLIEMADHLLDEGYKDPAAVIIGGVLESHLRKLSEKYGIALQDESGSSSRPKRAERLNQDLARAAYNALDQKSVTAWLDLRNKAAHAQYDQYSIDQVRLFSQSLKDFILRNPA